MKKTKILLITTGGTIAQQMSKEGLSPVKVLDLAPYLSDVLEFCDVHTEQMFNIDSTNITPRHWLELAGVIQEKYEEFDAFVITHGTDTMGYSSAALSYLIQNSTKPVVLTGSQRPIVEADSDAKQNLADAFRFACEKFGGVFVVFGGLAIHGTRAVKLRTKSRCAFDSVNYPPAALIEDRQVSPHASLRKLKNRQTDAAGERVKFYDKISEKVCLVKLVPGFKAEWAHFIEEHYDAVVIESYGSGGLPFPPHNDLMVKLSKMVKSGGIVVLTTQCLYEGSDLERYEVGQKALKIPVIPAHDMTTEAVLAKTMWALQHFEGKEALEQAMLTPVQFDIKPT